MNNNHEVAPPLKEQQIKELGFKPEALPILQNAQSITIAQIRQFLRAEVLDDFIGLVGTFERITGFFGSRGILVKPTGEDSSFQQEKPWPVTPAKSAQTERQSKKPKLNGTRKPLSVKELSDSEFVDDDDRPTFLDPLEQYLRAIAQIPLITKEQEVELAERIKKGDEAAREQMITANLRLVVRIAKKYRGLGMKFLDLINEGNLGLMKAVERFDPQKGAKLSTYSAFWIKQTIRRALANQSRDIRLPVHLIDKIAKMKRAQTELQHELERWPTDEEVADRLGVEVEKVKRMRSVNTPPVQLDSPLGDESDSTLADIIPDNRAANPAEDFSLNSDSERMQGFLSKLPQRDRKILSLRFGLNDGGDGLTLEQTGEVFGITRERIRQLQALALIKLRTLMNNQCYRTPTRKRKIGVLRES